MAALLQLARASAAARGIAVACVAVSQPFKRIALIAALMAGFGAGATPASAETAPKPVTVAAFGDSLVAGFGLAAADGFVPQLEAWLAANGAGPVAVQNAGVSGDTTTAGRARLDWSLGADVDAVLLELGANDALRGVDPEITRANLDAMLARLQERGLPVLIAGMRAPLNWGPDYVEAFEPIYPDLAAKYDAPLYPFFLDGVAGEPDLNQDDGIHPNAAGVAKIVEAIGPAVLELIETARSDTPEG